MTIDRELKNSANWVQSTQMLMNVKINQIDSKDCTKFIHFESPNFMTFDGHLLQIHSIAKQKECHQLVVSKIVAFQLFDYITHLTIGFYLNTFRKQLQHIKNEIMRKIIANTKILSVVSTGIRTNTAIDRDSPDIPMAP
eukprot:NODE_192_length_13323_cov_0.206216.p3 type:complete len:139 gc:universal NODE_192_length_13323_cov_0.206216:5780-6196(+)